MSSEATSGVCVGNGWSVKVLRSTPDASGAVQVANQFNDPPVAGKQFYMVEVEATYKGNGKDASQSPLLGLTFKALGPSNVAYDESSDSCGA